MTYAADYERSLAAEPSLRSAVALVDARPEPPTRPTLPKEPARKIINRLFSMKRGDAGATRAST
jgi:hypothetical protein